MKPKNKEELKTEIKKAIQAHGNEVDLNYINTSDVTDMSGLFENNTTFNGNISKWDTSNTTDTRGVFYKATSFNGDISTWDVSSVTTMSEMFLDATAFNKNISGWVNKSGRTITDMFYKLPQCRCQTAHYGHERVKNTYRRHGIDLRLS